MIRAGSLNKALSKSKTPSTAIPTNLKGSSNSQRIGYKTKAKIAKGQQKNNRKSQSNSLIIRHHLS